MAMNEEYLDSLLKSLTENEQKPRTMEQVMNEGKPADVKADISSDDLADMLDKIVINDFEPVSLEEEPEETEREPEEPEEIEAEAAAAEQENEDWKVNIDELLDSIGDEENNGDLNIDVLPETDSVLEERAALQEEMDVTELLDQMQDTDADLAEINGLLKKVDSNSAVDDDMLALLESVKDQDSVQMDGQDEPFDIFGSDEWKEESAKEGEVKDEVKEEGKSPKKKGLFGKKKHPGKSKLTVNSLPDLTQAEELSEQEIEDLKKSVNMEGADVKPEKKPGFLSRIFTFLVQEEPEEELNENAQIMKELDEEDKQKEKKKDKKKKKSSKKDEKESAQEDGGDMEDAPEADDKKKKKKEKKEKKKKEKEEKAREKPIKVLSRKNFLLMIGFCATLIACIFALSIFVAEYSDKQNAREAYYAGEYETAYQLLYDKKNITGSDLLVYNRVKAVLQLERRIESYENNLKLNRKMEALNSLLMGVSCYQELTEDDFYGIKEELDAVYQQICGLLSSQYNISEEEAKEINGYDNELYTLKVSSVVNGTEFMIPGQEVEEQQPPQDILPEEEDMISYQDRNEGRNDGNN